LASSRLFSRSITIIDKSPGIINTSLGNSKPHYYTLFVFSEIDPDDHDMKARLDAFSYDAAEFSHDGIRCDAMIMIKF
jgi:hypothetical protein